MTDDRAAEMAVSGAPMPGGHVAPVVRVGNTVRRVAGPWLANVAPA